MSNFRNLSKKITKTNSVPIYLRLREDINKIMTLILKNTNIDKRDFIEIAIIEHCLRFDMNLKYEGIDFKKYFEVLKYEKLRNYQAKIRSSIISRALFINRVRYDIIKLTSLSATSEDLEEYINERLTECKLYPNSKKLEKRFKRYIDESLESPQRLKKTIIKEIETNKENNGLKPNKVYEEMLLPEVEK